MGGLERSVRVLDSVLCLGGAKIRLDRLCVGFILYLLVEVLAAAGVLLPMVHVSECMMICLPRYLLMVGGLDGMT